MDNTTALIHNIVDEFITNNKHESLDALLRHVYISGYQEGHRAGDYENERCLKVHAFCKKMTCDVCPLHTDEFRCGRGHSWIHRDSHPGSSLEAVRIIQKYEAEEAKKKKDKPVMKQKPKEEELDPETEKLISHIDELIGFINHILNEDD